MTDNEKKEALEYCFTNEDCSLCPLFRNCPTSFELEKYVLDLIKRQQAEIEILHSDYTYKFVKTKAFKEFAERFEEEFFIGDITHSITKEEFEDFCKRNGG